MTGWAGPLPQPPVLRVTLRADGSVELWSDRARSTDDVAAILRRLAAGFESEPTRVL